MGVKYVFDGSIHNANSVLGNEAKKTRGQSLQVSGKTQHPHRLMTYAEDIELQEQH